jgi:hypothetical protein
MTLIRREWQDACAVEPDVADRWIVKTGDKSQECGFPAARRPEKRKKFAFFNRKTDAFERLKGPEGFCDVFYRYLAAFQVVCPLFRTWRIGSDPQGKYSF